MGKTKPAEDAPAEGLPLNGAEVPEASAPEGQGITLPPDMPDDAAEPSAEDMPLDGPAPTPEPSGAADAAAPMAQQSGDLAFLLRPGTAEEAVAALTAQGALDPEAVARIAWPDLFPEPRDDEEGRNLDEAALRAAIAQIEAGNSDLSRARLLEELAPAAAFMGEVEPGGGWGIDLHGVAVTAAGPKAALTQWCSKARQAILNGMAA